MDYSGSILSTLQENTINSYKTCFAKLYLEDWLYNIVHIVVIEANLADGSAGTLYGWKSTLSGAMFYIQE